SRLLLTKRFEKARPEAAQDQQLILPYRPALVLGGLGDHSSIEGKQRGCGPHITLQGFRHPRFDQCPLLADRSPPLTLTHRDLLAEFGGEVRREIWAALRTTLWVARLPRLEPGRLGRFAVPNLVFSGHR